VKNILNIAKYDLKKITGSVVSIITIMGLCLVPCLYAWFNIFSNWAPYESDATGRIAVAVANEDEGAKAAGLEVNVGDKIVTALEANEDIGWVFVSDEETAKKGVYASDYYAALVIPKNFSRDVLSFMNGSLVNPKLKYYENEKKNAIAPKITGKAQVAVKEQVNATFVETLAGYVSDAASIADAGGADPASVLGDLSDKADTLSRDMNSAIALSQSASALTGAAGDLMNVSDSFILSTQDVLDANEKLLDSTAKNLPRSKSDTAARDAASKHADRTAATLKALESRTAELLAADETAFDLYVTTMRDKNKAEVDALQRKALEHSKTLNAAGYSVLASEYTLLASDLGTISADLAALSADMDDTQRKAALNKLSIDIDAAVKRVEDIKSLIDSDIRSNLATALSGARNAYASYRNALTGANNDLSRLSVLMSRYDKSLGQLKKSIDGTTATLKSIQNGADAVSGLLTNAAGNALLRRIGNLLANDEAAVAEYLANPIRMETKVFWPIETYGSAMAPFYTVLAQWVGALLTAVLIKAKVKKRDDLVDLKLHEWYFGRYGAYLFVGLAQGLVVSLGDLLYIHIQCREPLLFVLTALVNGMVFMMINYALVFALDNIGLGAAVIILVLQVAGSGGTYPVEVLPEPFPALYPFMPFRYSMDAMRECIGGMYDGTYWKCMGILCIFFVVSVCLGLALYKPALWLNNLIAESKAKSEIML